MRVEFPMELRGKFNKASINEPNILGLTYRMIERVDSLTP